MQKDDLALLPRKKPGSSGTVAVGRVSGPYRYRADLPPDAYHTRPVEWLTKDLPRTSFDQDLLLSLGIPMTVFPVKRERADERILALVNTRKDRGLQAPAMIAESTPEQEAVLDVQQYARDQIRNHISRTFRGHDLAQLVNELLKAQGYQTQMSSPGPDGGVDILAGRGTLGFDPPRLCVQVKSSDQAVDVRPVRELQGVMKSFGAQHGLFVSWGGFKQSVLTETRQQFFEIRLWDADQLIDALLEQYDHLSEDLQTELPLKRIWTLVLEESS